MKIKEAQSIIGLKDLRENMGSYISGVGRGKSYIVVRRSMPIFKVSPVDVWGDEGIWETALDFRKIDPRGVSAGEVIAALKRLNAQIR